MAKSRSDDLFARLHAQGLRKRTAKLLSRHRSPPQAGQGRRALPERLKRAVTQVEDRLSADAPSAMGRAKRRRPPASAMQRRSDAAKKSRAPARILLNAVRESFSSATAP